MDKLERFDDEIKYLLYLQHSIENKDESYNEYDLNYQQNNILRLYSNEIEKVLILKGFIAKHIELIEKELDKDGWCRLNVDKETVDSFKKILEEV